ncbi:histidine--tRNA ligase, partial [candidate division TM6 bacterium RIFCSPHIGHO2_12_FULL_38_8]
MFPKVKGVADNFFDMPYWSGVIKKIESTLQSYNFSQINIPILEHVSLFERGLGYETDVVSKQMFVIQSKKEDIDSQTDNAICLRPEGTAGTMRAFLENQSNVATPAKVFFYGPMFRYERPQKGRLREFHQVNLEMIGIESILYDAQCIKMLQTLFAQTLQMQNIILKLNFLGETQDRQKFSQAFVADLQPKSSNLCAVCQVRLSKNPLRILDCKSTTCQELFRDAPKLSSFFSEQSKQDWQLLQENLKELSVTFTIDEKLVRGLDYYNKTVFEFASVNLGAQSAFCGGGRYDGLSEQLGSKVKIPALGCAIGMERLILILQAQQIDMTPKPAILICIIPLSTAQNKLALHLAESLITKGKTVEILL